MTDKKVLFISYAHQAGFGNIVIKTFKGNFNTEVYAALENQSICSYVLIKLKDYIEKEAKIENIVILNFIWINR